MNLVNDILVRLVSITLAPGDSVTLMPSFCYLVSHPSAPLRHIATTRRLSSSATQEAFIVNPCLLPSVFPRVPKVFLKTVHLA
jgi:hypothetical protein